MTRQHWVVTSSLGIAGLGLVAALLFLQTPPDPIISPYTASDALLRLEADRDTWNRPSDVVSALALSAGATVADVGARSGYFTVKLSRTVGPPGTVYAIDVDSTKVTELQARIAGERLTNVNVSLGRVDDPGLPVGALDAVLISDAYHEMVEHEAILHAIRQALKPSGRLVVVEKMAAKDEGKTRDKQTRSHHIASSLVVSELAEAGFNVIDRIENFAEVPAGYGGGMLWRIIAIPTASASDTMRRSNGSLDQ